MKQKYKKWISDNYPTFKTSYGQCSTATTNMSKKFPELNRVRGHYLCPVLGDREHWWLVDSDGTIVDPTVIQFPSVGIGDYIEWREGDKEPTGKCMNCGEYSYNGTVACSDTCLSAIMEDFN